MSLVSQVSTLATRLGTEFKNVYAKIGDITALTTSNKTSFVAALNEVNAKPSGTGGAAINDNAVATTTVYSSSKTVSVVDARVNALTSGAATALDTLVELGAAIGNDANFAATMTTALGNRLIISGTQSLTTAQQTFGQNNLNVYSKTDVGDPTTDFVAVFNAALV